MSKKLVKIKIPCKNFRILHFEDKIKKLIKDINDLINILVEDKSKTESNITNSMRDLIKPSAEIENNFPNWFDGLVNLEINLNRIDSYKKIYEKIKLDDLPKHSIEFEKYLKKDMVEKISRFDRMLLDSKEEIEEQISLINTSLKDIDFSINPQKTYIQIEFKDSYHEKIVDFKLKLKNSIPDLNMYNLTEDKQILDSAFKNIQTLFKSLEESENYRKYVIDTRNWLEFTAKEYFRDSNEQKAIYETTGSLSGGEKPQLAYTILCSGIAYQYNIGKNGNNNNSFRLVMVDEAFNKQDEEKATYLMELCEKLKLQLLFVTPNDKASITIPFISTCHYIEKLGDSSSIIHPWTKLELEENIRKIENEE